jgi:hypothetical protein
LSNPIGLINLLGSLIRESGLSQAACGKYCKLAVKRRWTHIPAVDPADGSGRPGAAIWTIWTSVRDSSMAPSENIIWSLSAFPWDFERLCHVAINL